MSRPTVSLQQFIREVRGRSGVLAVALGVSSSLVSMWATGRRPIPLMRCRDIVAATNGRVALATLRPDVVWTRVPTKKGPQ